MGGGQWAVLVCSSRYWYNYRHLANILAIFRILKRNGFPDDRIIILNSNSAAYDERNPQHGSISFHTSDRIDLGQLPIGALSISDTTVAQFIDIFLDQRRKLSGKIQQLRSDEQSQILIYLSGHGGDEFFKFQDREELSAREIGFLFDEFYAARKYERVLLIVETCQAQTLANHISAPNVTFIGSSMKGENSYAYHINEELEVALLDRFAISLNDFLSMSFQKNHDATISDLMGSFNYDFLHSRPFLRSTCLDPPEAHYLKDYFIFRSPLQLTSVSEFHFEPERARLTVSRRTVADQTEFEQHQILRLSFQSRSKLPGPKLNQLDLSSWLVFCFCFCLFLISMLRRQPR